MRCHRTARPCEPPSRPAAAGPGVDANGTPVLPLLEREAQAQTDEHHADDAIEDPADASRGRRAAETAEYDRVQVEPAEHDRLIPCEHRDESKRRIAGLDE